LVVTDFLDEKHREIVARLDELKPLVEEYSQLEAAAAALAGVSGAPRPAKRRAGRSRGRGERAAEALSLVQEQPGITIPELATKMGIEKNYLYRVLPRLKRVCKVKRSGYVAGWEHLGP
jgi:hypothetical protein